MQEDANCNPFLASIETLPDTPFAFFVLTGTIDPHIFHWTSFLPRQDFTIFFIEDSINVEEIIPFETVFPMNDTKSSPPRFILHLDKKVLRRKRYGGMNFVKGWISAWEKAMYFLIELKPTYQYMWFMEDDVLLLTPEAFLNIHKQLVEKQIDLSGNKYHSGGPNNATETWENWDKIKDIQRVYTPPFYHGMACSVGISQKLLQKIAWFRTQVQRFEFLEVMFYTIAEKENLKIHTPVALREIVWRTKYTCYDIIKLKKFWYHPVKHQKDFIHRCIDTHTWKGEVARYQTPALLSPTRIKNTAPALPASCHEHLVTKQQPKNQLLEPAEMKNVILVWIQLHEHYRIEFYQWTAVLPASEFVVVFAQIHPELSSFSRLSTSTENNNVTKTPRFLLSIRSNHSLLVTSFKNHPHHHPLLLPLVTTFLSTFLPSMTPCFTWIFDSPVWIPSSQAFLRIHSHVIQTPNRMVMSRLSLPQARVSDGRFTNHVILNAVLGLSQRWLQEYVRSNHSLPLPSIGHPNHHYHNHSSEVNPLENQFVYLSIQDGRNKSCEEILDLHGTHSAEWWLFPPNHSKTLSTCLSSSSDRVM